MEAYALVEMAAAGRLRGEARKPEGVVVLVVEGSEAAEAAAARRRSYRDLALRRCSSWGRVRRWNLRVVVSLPGGGLPLGCVGEDWRRRAGESRRVMSRPWRVGI